MFRRFLSVICTVAIVLGLIPAAVFPINVRAAETASSAPFQVGFARVDINPYIEDGNPDSGIMALPLRGFGDEWNRLSIDGLIDDNGDGLINEEDGLKATCISVTDENGKTVLMITTDLIGGTMGDQVRPAVVERVNAAIAGGELTGIQAITKDEIYLTGTHTHEGPDILKYNENGMTGTNTQGYDLSVANEQLGIWIERTVEDICDSAIMALKDRSAAQLTKDQLAAPDATSPVVKGKRMMTTRHYFTEVDGEEFVSGDGFNAVTKAMYANPSDYRTSRGVNPKQVTAVDETIYLLRFAFADESKLPIILTSWRGHPSLASSETYGNGGKSIISSDYINAYRHALEYGCDISFDTTNGVLTGWTFGTQRQYRVALFMGSSGNVNTRAFEQVIYSGSDGDVLQRGYTWIDKSAATAAVKGTSSSYGVVLAQLARECIEDGLNETPVAPGEIVTASMTYSAKRKTVGITELSYKAGLACQEAMAAGAVTYPFEYTDPDTGEVFLISSRFHPSTLAASWSKKLGAPISTPTKIEVGAFLLGKELAFVALPVEPFDFYYEDLTLTGEDRYADSNNLWNSLINEDSYGKPFILGYCNGAIGYLPNYDAYTYCEGSTTRVMGSYETHSSRLEQGTGENVIRLLGTMLSGLSTNGGMTYTAPCAYCGENQLWQPYNLQTELTTGHYYLGSDVSTAQIKVSGGQTVCLDLNGHSFEGLTRALYTSDSTKDIVNIMDSSGGQTGIIQGCGATYGAASGFGGGSILVSQGDELNLYSGTIGYYHRKGYSALNGGSVLLGGTLNVFGGKIAGGYASAFEGTYFSGSTIKSSSKVGYGGAVMARPGSALNVYGGEITSGEVRAITGSANADDTYTETYVTLDNNGPCVWIAEGANMTLSGNGSVDHIHMAGESGLNVSGTFTGRVELQFETITELTDGIVVGTCMDADVSCAQISFTNAPEKTAAVMGETLVVSDLPYSYLECPQCGQVQWKPMTDVDFDAFGKSGWKPGHYRLTEDVSAVQQQLNYNGDAAGNYCLDLAGHTFTGASRAFVTYSGATLNILDSVGGGVVASDSSSAMGGGVLYAISGSAINLYSGTVRRNSTNSEYNLNGGAVRINGGAFTMYGGTLIGNPVTDYGGAVYVSGYGDTDATLTLLGGRIISGTADKGGDCVYVGDGSQIVVSGEADIEELFFGSGSADSLVISGEFTGKVTLAYPDSVALNDGTVVGKLQEADISGATIEIIGSSCKCVVAQDSDLVIAEVHSYEAQITAPTCTEVGFTTYTCTTCGHSYIADEVPSNGHSWVEATCTDERYCSVCGLTEGNALGHSYESVVTAPTCTDDGFTTHTCSVCGHSYTSDTIAATGHNYETVTVDPTCTETGSITNTCASCGDEVVELIPATGHTHQAVVTDPTCTEKGYTTYTCHCGDSYVGDYVDATGHIWADGTLTCTVCGHIDFLTAPCDHCGEAQWQLVTDADFDAFGKSGWKPGHYRLTEDVSAVQQQVNYNGDAAGNYCLDLAGHTFTGASRAFVTYSGATLNILDSVGGGVVASDSSSAMGGGVLYAISGSAINLYSGTVRRNATNGAYNLNGGAVRVNGGSFTMYGGTLIGNPVSDYGGAVYVSDYEGKGGIFTVLGGTITSGSAGKGGDCVYVSGGSDVTISGNAVIDEIYFAQISSDSLIFTNTFTGSVSVRYPDSVELDHGTDLGNVVNADIEKGSIVIVGAPCKKVESDGTNLLISHIYDAVVTPPTCTEDGFTTYTCPICGDSYISDETDAIGHSYETVTVDPTCTEDGSITNTCVTCGDTVVEAIPATGHKYEAVITASTCTEKGYTTYTCHCGDSYIADEVDALGHSYETVSVDPNCTEDGSIVNTCNVCGDVIAKVIPATGHSFANGYCTICGDKDPDYMELVIPNLSLKYPTLAFEDEIMYNVYFNVDDLTSVEEMGLVVFADRNYEGTIAEAIEIIPGFVVNADGSYTARTNGVPAKMLGDAMFFKVYANLTDGSYVYSGVVGYHAVAYANTILNSAASSAKAKALVVAMLNYGAAAQVNFNYKTDALMNAGLTADQLALVQAYDESMVAEVPAVGNKAGSFVMNGGYTDIHPTVSFEGAFSINYYFTPRYTPDDGVVNFYYWNFNDFNTAEVLTPENATGTVQMTSNGAVYTNPIQGIAAKQIDEPVYVAGLYVSGDTTYTTPVIGYSLGAYCKNIAQSGNAFGAATAVYGFYAKDYFNLNG